MGGGGNKRPKKQIIYMNQPSAPQQDNTFADFLAYQMQQDNIRRKEIQDEKDAEEATKKQRADSAVVNLGSVYQGIEDAVRSGLMTYEGGRSELQDYESAYGLQPGATSSYINNLTNIYTNDVRPGRQLTGIKTGFQEILGREATEEEIKKFSDRFSSGYYKTMDDMRGGIRGMQEYKDKVNDNYLDNYYDTQYGDQLRDKDGKLTGQRTFKWNEKYMPKFTGDLAGKAGIEMPKFENMTGTVQELEEFQQSIRQSRQYLYSAGLTNLQGDIDKSLQKLKNEGSKETIRTSKEGDIYTSVVQAFNF